MRGVHCTLQNICHAPGAGHAVLALDESVMTDVSRYPEDNTSKARVMVSCLGLTVYLLAKDISDCLPVG